MSKRPFLPTFFIIGLLAGASLWLGGCQFMSMIGLGSGRVDKNVIWKAKAPMPTPRALLGIAVIGDKLYALGGVQSDNRVYTAVEMFNPVEDKWQTVAAMSTPRADFAVEVISNKIYVVGGYNPDNDDYYLRSLEVFDPATNTWETKAPMSTPRAGLAAGAVNGKLYVLGGNCNKNWESGCLYTVEEYNPATDTWTKKEALPTPRADLAAAVVNGKIYAIGGAIYDNGEWYYLGNVEEYDPDNNTWKNKTAMVNPRCDCGVAVFGSEVYVAGGICSVKNSKQALSLNDVDIYYPDRDKWAKKYPLPTVRYSLGLGVVRGKIYAIGGITGSEYLDKVEEYTP